MTARVSAAVAGVYAAARLTADPGVRGPVPLNKFFEAGNVAHVAIPALTLAAVAKHLLDNGFVSGAHVVSEFLADAAPLAGLLFRIGDDAIAFVNADDILQRRRFTAAHELGHALLHRETMGRVLIDATISDSDDPAEAMEREANTFAAELLMPKWLIQERADELRTLHGCCPRAVLGYRLAAELLVSPLAMRYRLKTLGVGDDD